MVMISPQIATTNSAPADSRTSAAPAHGRLMRDMHAALVLGHPAGDALLVVAVANRLLFVAIAHRADLGLPMSQRLGEFIENTQWPNYAHVFQRVIEVCEIFTRDDHVDFGSKHAGRVQRCPAFLIDDDI
jgi:hypothetical protein